MSKYSQHPEYCPITGRGFFMCLEHPELGLVATYGGPFDSYTIPVWNREDQEFRSERFDHDIGNWVEGGEPYGIALIAEEKLIGTEEAVAERDSLRSQLENAHACIDAIGMGETGPIPITPEGVRQYVNGLMQETVDVTAERDALRAELAERDRKDILGCHAHGCLVSPTEGQGTNSGCQCKTWKLHTVIRKLRAELATWKAAVEGLTPNGSEYVNDSTGARWNAMVKGRKESSHD